MSTKLTPFEEKFGLQPLPRIECPDWVGENVRGCFEDVRGHIEKAQAVRDEVEKNLAKMSNELALADFTLPTPAEKAKTRAKLLQSELRAREQAADYYSALRLESREIAAALREALTTAQQKVQVGLFSLGFEDFDPANVEGGSKWQRRAAEFGSAEGVRNSTVIGA